MRICGWSDLSCVLFHPTSDVFNLETAEDIASCVCHCFRSMPTPPWLCVKKSNLLLEHKWMLLVPKHLLHWLQKISIHKVNVRTLVEILIKDYQMWMLMHPQTITETFLRSRNCFASGLILYPFYSNILYVNHQCEK